MRIDPLAVAAAFDRIAALPTREERVAALDALDAEDQGVRIEVEIKLRNADLYDTADTLGWRRWFELNPSCPKPEGFIPTPKK
jgi:hypothetical protein